MHFAVLPVLTVAAFTVHARSQAIDPSSVPLGTRNTWCTNQKASCPLLCTQINGGDSSWSANNCDAQTLVWQCICSNGITPNASEYSQTIPFYECQQSNQQCADNCDPSDSACVTACQTAHPCGAQHPRRYNTTSTSGTASATGTSTSEATSGASGSAAGSAAATSAESPGFFGAPASTSSSAASANIVAGPLTLLLPEVYGLIVLAGSFTMGFAFVL